MTNHTLLNVGVTLILLGAIGSLLLAITKASGQQQPQFTQPQQQPQYPYQYQQPQPQQPSQQQPYTQQQPPTARFLPPQQQPAPGMMQLMNESKVIGCLNKVLDDSIIRGSEITIQNNINHTVSMGLRQSFIINATNTLDACILPRR